MIVISLRLLTDLPVVAAWQCVLAYMSHTLFRHRQTYETRHNEYHGPVTRSTFDHVKYPTTHVVTCLSNSSSSGGRPDSYYRQCAAPLCTVVMASNQARALLSDFSNGRPERETWEIKGADILARPAVENRLAGYMFRFRFLFIYLFIFNF